MSSNIYTISNKLNLRQGDVIADLIQFKIDINSIESEEKSIVLQTHPFAIVVSQDCDLDWDYKHRFEKQNLSKELPCILFCELDYAVNLRNQHQRNKERITSDRWNIIKTNKNERYHFLQKPDSTIISDGFELVVDFKRYFAIPSDEVYKQLEISKARKLYGMNSPYLEHFCTRFYYFQSRIALPEDHASEPS